MAERKKPGRKPGDPNNPRRGNGAGWGGPAKGPGRSSRGLPGPGRSITGKTVAELMALEGAREIAAERWMAILRDPAHPKHADMVVHAAKRLDGDPEQRVTSEVHARYVVRAPEKAESIEEWEAQHSPKAL